MIQRFIFNVLKDGVEQVTDDPTIIDQIFQELYGLSETETEAIKAHWIAKPPVIRHGYAPRDIDVPTYSIILENETESQTWLNNDVGTVEDPEDPDFRADVFGSIWQHQYGILIFAEHPDVTTYYYEIAKSILLSGNEFFIGQGLFDIDISGGDLAPDPRYIPEHLFARRVSFGCQRIFTRVDRPSRLTKVTSVEGIHIDSSGSPSDVGGVKTNVTILEEGDT